MMNEVKSSVSADLLDLHKENKNNVLSDRNMVYELRRQLVGSAPRALVLTSQKRKTSVWTVQCIFVQFSSPALCPPVTERTRNGLFVSVASPLK